MRCDTKLLQIQYDTFVDQIRVSLGKTFKIAIFKNFLMTNSSGLIFMSMILISRNICKCSLYYLGPDKSAFLTQLDLIKEEIKAETGFQIFRSNILKFMAISHNDNFYNFNSNISSNATPSLKNYLLTESAQLYRQDIPGGPFNKTLNKHVVGDL